MQTATIAEKAAEHEQHWRTAYGRFGAVVEQHDLRVGAEVGVAFGGHAEALLSMTSIDRLYGVDPYKHFMGYDDPMNLPQREFDKLRDFMLNRLEPYGERFELLRTTSLEAAERVPRPLDFVFIDASHTCEAVWKDLVAWTPTVRVGGILGGHDYGHVDFPGVQAAIDAFCARTGWKLQLAGETVWWVERGDLPPAFAFGDPPCRDPSPFRTWLAVTGHRLQRAITIRKQ